MSLDALIEKQNTEFYDLGHEHGYDKGFEAGILEAVKILRKGTADEEPEEEEPEIVSDVFARKSPFKHIKHHNFWKENVEVFVARLKDKSMSVSEAVEAVNLMASRIRL